MNKKAILGIAAAVSLLFVLAIAIYSTSWHMTNETPEPIPYEPVTPSGEMNTNSLNYVLFEEYGPLLIVVALLMFGAIIGGICVAHEETEDDTESKAHQMKRMHLYKATQNALRANKQRNDGSAAVIEKKKKQRVSRYKERTKEGKK